MDTSSILEQVCAHCMYINFVVGSQSRSECVEHIIELLTSNLSSHPTHSGAIRFSQHSTGVAGRNSTGTGECAASFIDATSKPLSEIINTTMTNADDGGKSNVTCSYYSDATLGWWLTFNTNHLPNHKQFRVVHKGRLLFLSSSGKKTLKIQASKTAPNL